MYQHDIIEVHGFHFRVDIVDDDSNEAPWQNDYGTGVVTDWERREKRPGERILNTDHGSKRFYDFQASMAKARRDGWGLMPDDVAELGRKLQRTPTRGDIVVEAVERDFKRLYDWCNDQWCYVGVVVTKLALDEDGEPDKGTDIEWGYSLWGIESDSYDYHKEVALELANECVSDLRRADTADIEYWANQNVYTVGGYNRAA